MNINIIKDRNYLTKLGKESISKIKYTKKLFYLKDNVINQFNSFINKCKCKSKTILNKRFKTNINPKITAIIPLYNSQKYINYSLCSLQNQNFQNLEIILIDDNSKDNTRNIIEKYMKFDKRINLIKNKENKKILYSKSIAAINAKGKYIFELDHDDILIRDNVLELLFYEIETNNLDSIKKSKINPKKLDIQNFDRK